MSEEFNLVALMPMRHDSERVRGKNYRPFGDGRPLFHHMLETLSSCAMIDQIVINTDSSTIAEQAENHFPEVRIVPRPESLLGGMTPMNDILLHDVSLFPSTFYLQTHSTNPLLSAESLNRAVDVFFENFPTYDSLFSVTRFQTRLWDGLARAVNHNPEILLRTQDLPPVFEENSCLYIFPRETLVERRNRIGARPFLYETEPLESLDIDEEVDFKIAEAVFRERSRAKGI